MKMRNCGQEVEFCVLSDVDLIETDTQYTVLAPVQDAEQLPTIEEPWQEMIQRVNEGRRKKDVSKLVSNNCSRMSNKNSCRTVRISQETC